MERILISSISSKLGETVHLLGWVNSRRDHGKITFIDLRDRTGIVQVVLSGDLAKNNDQIRDEYILEVVGKVAPRPDNMVNLELPLGNVEVQAQQIAVISKSQALPFSLTTDGYEVSEPVRLDFRYLDLRRERMAKNLRLRHKIIKNARAYLDNLDFVEIETPYISKPTPEGARDFLVPSRLQPGCFYALPQSPQQYKQMLMAAGFEKYYQIARCFRDEDPRADRAYGEFTQLDIELSFTSQEEILNLVENLMIKLTEEIAGKQVMYKPFPRISYKQAMECFGQDKFDLRLYRHEGDVWIKEREQVLPEQENTLGFAWVLDFPLFEKTHDRVLRPSHHPFTAPKDEDIPLLDRDPYAVRSWQHDLVCNGHEVSGGSIRITDPELQAKIFSLLGHSSEDIQKKFGHLLRAFSYGVPPHGGIACGVDRLMSLWAGEPSLRETIAFPMTSGGRMAVMGMPSEADTVQLKELGIKPTVLG